MTNLEMCFINLSCAMVRGYGSRELLVELRGSAPVWSSLSRAWTCQPKTARSLIALAESRGRHVVVIDEGRLRLHAEAEVAQERQEAAEVRGLLW